MTPEHPRGADRDALGRFLSVVVAAGSAALVLVAIQGPDSARIDPAIVAVLTALVAMGVYAPLRVQYRGGVAGFTLDDAVVLAMLFALPGRWIPVLVAAAAACAHLLRGAEATKVAYNAANRSLSASAAVVGFHLVGSSSEVLSLPSVSASLVAMAAYNLVNLSLQSVLRSRLTGSRVRDAISELGPVNVATSSGNLIYGLVLAFLAMQDAVATLLGGSIMVGLYLGYRGYAAMLEERRRAERLHQLTRSLADVRSSDESTQMFLQDLRSVLGAEGASLMLIESHERRETVCAGTAQGDPEPSPHLQAAVTRGAPVLFEHLDGRHRDALAAPVIYEGRTVGAIAVYDRVGLEPWDDTDATLLGTIANEVAVAFKNVELFAAVERERALLAEESRKLSDIVDNASDGIAMIEADGRVAAWNDAMAELTGLDAGQAFGQPWYTVLRLRARNGDELLPDAPNAVTRALRGDVQVEVDFQVLRRDGQWRWVRCSMSPIERSGRGVVGAVLVARDVTREREVEELKGDFIATVSHELRTPLTPLRGFLDTFTTRRRDLSEQQIDTILGSMRTQVTRLERLVGDLLVVADVERGELGLRAEAVDVVGLIAESVARIQPPLDEERLTVEAPEGLGAVGDQTAIVRIVSSLIDNAAKHTAGSIVVRVSREDDRAVIAVEDEGNGIAPWDHDRIFKRFDRLGNHLHRTQGPGLGLPIARALARTMGGDVVVESDVGRGATFRLELPASAPRAVPTDRADSRRQDGNAG